MNHAHPPTRAAVLYLIATLAALAGCGSSEPDATSSGSSTGGQAGSSSGSGGGDGGAGGMSTSSGGGGVGGGVGGVGGGGGSGGSSSGLVPLTDMGASTYMGFAGGLYASGNKMPMEHAAAGVALAQSVEPLATDGSPSPSGKVVLLSVGMSNTTQEFCSKGGGEPCDAWTFMGQAAMDATVNKATLAMVNGALGGQTAATWDDPADMNYDRVLNQHLTPVGLSEAQVQAAWVKLANPKPAVSLPSDQADAFVLEEQLGDVVRAMRVRYPNLKLVFLSSRIYAGYATTDLNPEPFAYETGFSVKWLIEAQMAQAKAGGMVVDMRAGDLGPAAAPWLAWGPYMWADGETPRSDGLTWSKAEFENDGTHPAKGAEQKVGKALLNFFTKSPHTKCWFVAGGTCP